MAGTLLINGAASAGDTTVGVDGFTASTGDVQLGTPIWLGTQAVGDPYLVTADASIASNAASLAIFPPLSRALADDAVDVYYCRPTITEMTWNFTAGEQMTVNIVGHFHPWRESSAAASGHSREPAYAFTGEILASPLVLGDGVPNAFEDVTYFSDTTTSMTATFSVDHDDRLGVNRIQADGLTSGGRFTLSMTGEGRPSVLTEGSGGFDIEATPRTQSNTGDGWTVTGVKHITQT
jgi:hypothetical protein